MRLKFKYLRLGKLGKFAILAMLLVACLLSVKFVSALDSTVVRVNGTIIYETPGGYNASHGISGVTFDTEAKTLNLTSASLESIYANGDLTINITNNNAIDAVTSNIAVEVRGNLTVIGANGSALNVSAMSADDRAIEISAGSTLTVGDAGNLGNLITVNIQRGRNVNTVDHTTIVAGNTYNYTPPAGGGDPEGPPAGDPLQIFVDGFVAIDETADPQITSVSGEGWSIEQGFMGIYQLNIDSGTTLPYITGTGDGALSINPQGGDITITENEDHRSINMTGNVEIMTGMGATPGDISLIGGIHTEGRVNINDRDMTIGSSGAHSLTGVEARELNVGSGNLTIYTDQTGFQYYTDTPAEGEGMLVESSAGKTLTVATSNLATANVNSVRVSGGGSVDLTHTSGLRGSFVPEASHWPWTDMTGTEEENPLPTTVTCEEGTDNVNKYRMTTTDTNFLLESTAGTLYQLGWNIPGADDSIVTNGTVRVIAANGFRFTSGGYTDYSLEAGSEVTIELLPDYGYQYVSGGLNGNPTVPEEGKGSYTFTMPSNHLHLSAVFERSSDIIAVNSSKISGASIAMPENEINGNAEFSVSDASGASTSTFQSAASGATIGGLVDLTLNEVVYKGTSDEAWKTNVTQLDNNMSVNLALADNLKGHSNYSILRDHNGTVTKLDTTYDAAAGTLSFATDAYSTYAIAYSDTPSNPNTYDGIRTYLIIGLLSLAGLAGLIVYRRKNKLRLT